jgi:DNA-directed RNA polymerase specialized sigma24 family protein
MTTQSKIASRANALSRTVYASLPFHFRVARFLFQIRLASYAESYGRALYAEFIKAGVTDMPPIGKLPAEELRPQLIQRGNRAAGLLPLGYGKQFGKTLWSIVRKSLGPLYRSDDNTAEVLQKVMVELYGGSQQAIKGVPLPSAESYIKKRVAWRAQDFKRNLARSPQSIEDPNIMQQVELMNEGALRKFVYLLGPRGRKELSKALSQVDRSNPEKALDWVNAQMEGKSGKEIAEEWGVSQPAVTQWVNRHLRSIQNAFRQVADVPV